ncbi:MAG TPA: TonB family protein [Candidatus Acidoferrales bacterium]
MPLSDSMSNGNPLPSPDRRQNARHSSNSLSYVHLDESNGGILINLSEGGLAVHAAMSVMEDDLPRVRLQMPRSAKWLETSARVVWSSDSRRMVGVEFLELQEDTRKQICEWLAHEAGENDAVPDEPVEDKHTHEHQIHAANVEEIPLKAMRHSPQSRVQALNAAEFDMAALLTSREAAKIAVARTMKIPAEATPAIPTTSVTKEAPADVSTAPENTPSARSNAYVLVLVVLALLSLVAGWEAAKGDMFQTLRALFLPSSTAATAAKAATATRPAGAFATNFEVIDANNQAWLVPFTGPVSAPSGPALPALPARAVASLNQPAPRNANSFQLWNLTAPQAARSSSAQVAAAAPVLPTSQGAMPLPPSIAEPGPNFSLVPPTVQPQTVQPHSSLVAPKLLHSVQPIYPTAALNQHIEGNVTVHAHIMENGAITEVTAISGPPLLAPAAVNAVRAWKYKPEILDGRAVASDVVVTIQFSLPH